MRGIIILVWSLAAWVFAPAALAAGVATITLDPSQALLTERGLPTKVPPGSIAAIPDSGVDILLSSDTQTALNNAIKNNCGSPGSEQCQASIAQVLNGKSLQASQLQPRFAPLIIAGLVALASIVISSTYLANEPVPQAIHITPAQFNQAANIASASAVVAVPATSGAATTFTIPPKATTASSIPTVSIQASSGDLHIGLSSAQASAFMAVMQLPGVCLGGSASKHKKRDLVDERSSVEPQPPLLGRATTNADCIAIDANALIYNAFTGIASSFQFLSASTPLSSFSDPTIDAALNNFLAQWEPAAPAFGVSVNGMDNIATVAFDLAYIWNQQGTNLGTDNVISGSLLSTPKCPYPAGHPESTTLICAETTCKGDGGIKRCTVPPWKDCVCMNQQSNNYEYYNNNLDIFADQPDALLAFLAGPPPAPPPNPLTCYSAKAQVITSYVSPDTAYDAVSGFCSGVNANSVINANSEFNQNTPDHFSLGVSGTISGSWSQELCTGALNSILTYCDGSPSNPMNWKWGGTYTTQGLTFNIQPLYKLRVWPAPTSPTWVCTGTYGFGDVFDNYGIYGAGWSNSDFGQKALYPSITRCTGSAPTAWTFIYGPYESNGQLYEWFASFHTVIWIKAKCFNNCKVSGWAGGPAPGTDCRGCSGKG